MRRKTIRKGSPAASSQAPFSAKSNGKLRKRGGSNGSYGYESVFREWLEGIDVGVASVSPRGQIFDANSRFAEILGLAAVEELRHTNLRDHISPDSWHTLDSALLEATAGPVQGEMHVGDEGSIRTVHVSLNAIPESRNNTIRLVISEITDLLATTKALRDYEASVQSLSARILRLQDEERRRIARELHDTTGQELAVLLLSLSKLTNDLEKAGAQENIRRSASDSVTLARRIEEQIRTLSYVLHPPLLDELGLGAALNWYAEGFKKRTGIKVEVATPTRMPRFSVESETALFRVVQESLSNVLRHSGSNRAQVCFSFHGGVAEVCIRDEGRGIDPQKLVAAQKGMSLGVGIPGMRERLQQFGGSVEIRSDGRGTAVIARLPVKERDAPDRTRLSRSRNRDAMTRLRSASVC